MSLLRALFRSKSRSASVAKDRLQVLIASERTSGTPAEWLPRMQKDLIEVIGRYVPVSPGSVKVEMERGENIDVLEINIVLPEQARKATS